MPVAFNLYGFGFIQNNGGDDFVKLLDVVIVDSKNFIAGFETYFFTGFVHHNPVLHIFGRQVFFAPDVEYANVDDKSKNEVH